LFYSQISPFCYFNYVRAFGSYGWGLLLFCADWYLLLSAEKAFGADGNLKQPKQLSINKVGHGKL